ncbi:hypothetical protein L1887_31552 [Cichorium endivia]|nr:hypothetical protein L1887_31552 [Cichorium endivia]
MFRPQRVIDVAVFTSATVTIHNGFIEAMVLNPLNVQASTSSGGTLARCNWRYVAVLLKRRFLSRSISSPQQASEATVTMCSGFIETVVLSPLNGQASASQRCSMLSSATVAVRGSLNESAVKQWRYVAVSLKWWFLTRSIVKPQRSASQRRSGTPVAGADDEMFEEEDEGVAM